ncbi:MAG: DEAD/DEAH box helicase, partial [Candidatus Cloacimonetes bacterium]|nr:DEAD/DEAH box helicase [Candidatus Cloacimonadota bacterium]
MSLDPIEATRAITKRYSAYLSTSFNLLDSDLNKQFLVELSPDKFVKGPILEITPPFESGKTIEELIDEEVLSGEFKRLNTETLPLNRLLYKHQESAILKTVLENQNIVVATGTGSGKTESFMIPILNYLFRQKEKSELTPGVRALLLYPMNALANDQLKRMRKILKNYPDISFGRYTGETEESRKSAEEKFIKMYKTEPLPNERISREEMKKNPPHILLTNYAMLEYLMLRPADNVFFDGKYADNWKFIVIDEAHTYNGAKGIEMGMLLRRLKERVVQSAPSKLRCIVTSATLGSGANKLEDVIYFASELFGETFNSKSVIEASRRKDCHKASWGAPSSVMYCEWQKIINDNPLDIIPLLIESSKNFGIPTEILENAKSRSFNDLNKFLYYTLKGDGNLASLKSGLEIEPQSVETIADKIFPGDFSSKRALVALVELAVKAKCGEDDQSLIPARYHLFVRDIEGAYLSLKPEYKLYLERRERVIYEEQEYQAFEIASCRNCGAVYLVGETEKEGNIKKFKQPGNKYFEDSNNLEYYLLLDKNIQLLPENEDEITDLVQDEKQLHKLCGKCGAIDRSSRVSPICECGEDNYIEILRVESPKGLVHKCPACTKTNTKGSVVFRFLLGKDAIASVLATSLYQQIPAKKEGSEDNSIQEKSEEDEWTFTTTQNLDIKSDNMDLRQLLIFSDSRQDAAFFAPYLNRTYSQILRRRLLLEIVERNIDKIQENHWRIQDLIPVLKQQVVQLNLFPEYSQQEVENEIWKWVLHELLVIDSKIGLEGMGCLGFKLVKPEGWRAPPPLMNDPLNLSEDEVWILYQVLLDGFRKYGAVLYPEPLNPEDEFFEPINQDRYFRESGTSKNRNIKSWVPSSEKHLNTRLDFLMRLAQNMGVSYSRKECMDLLRNIWRSLSIENSGSPWNKFFSSTNLKGEGVVYKIKPNFWELQPASNSKGEKLYYCEKCNNLTLFNLKGTCPTYKCEGRLRECDPNEILKDNHYRNLYYELLPLKMWSEEHTAQLKSEAAAELQTQFIKGEVNVLSCSTTFELGVDVGELESVFMRNVPPSASNYIQRAGRAGRRTDSTAFVLTFCKRSPHDLTHFYSPIKLVSGEIKTPHFEILNEKIILRHIYATALAEFWKKYPSMFNNVESFFFNEGKSGPELFKDYLDSKPQELYESLCRIIPESLHKKLKLDDWGWAEDLYDPRGGVMLKAKDEVETDV